MFISRAQISPDSDREKARELILSHGWNSTAYQLLNPGIQLWFSRRRDAVIGFVSHARTRVVGGAPVCELARLEAVAAEFRDDSRDAGDRVCYFGAGDRLDEFLARSQGWSRVLLGAQPTWNPANWSASVSRRSSLRAQFSRARNKGVVVKEWIPAEAENHPSLRRCLEEWLAARRLPPLHFMIEPETLSNLRDRRVFVAEVGQEVVGFTILSPVPARNGWLVEQIVRGARAPNGTNELLLDTAVRSLANQGSSYVTLGLSPLSRRAMIAPPPQPAWLGLLLSWMRVHARRFYNFEGLDAFKAKFNPETWEPIYAIADARKFPPRALYAIAGAFSGGQPLRLVGRALWRAAVQEISALTG
ncbi:MAG: phosphatidylglycerol lysyltransferase domain-containing protein [Gemmatimonadaceae bacterium]